MAPQGEFEILITPADFMALIHSGVGRKFDMDVAAPDPRGVQCYVDAEEYANEENDGLGQPWRGVCWMNPPYRPVTEMERFVRKAIEETSVGDCDLVVALMPWRSDQAWWNQAVEKHSFTFPLRRRIEFIVLDDRGKPSGQRRPHNCKLCFFENYRRGVSSRRYKLLEDVLHRTVRELVEDEYLLELEFSRIEQRLETYLIANKSVRLAGATPR